MNEKKYPSDLTDKEWQLIEPLVPGPQKLGRPPRYRKRQILNAIFYVVRSGCSWRMIPNDLPSWRICDHYFSLWKKQNLRLAQQIQKAFEGLRNDNRIFRVIHIHRDDQAHAKENRMN